MGCHWLAVVSSAVVYGRFDKSDIRQYVLAVAIVDGDDGNMGPEGLATETSIYSCFDYIEDVKLKGWVNLLR